MHGRKAGALVLGVVLVGGVGALLIRGALLTGERESASGGDDAAAENRAAPEVSTSAPLEKPGESLGEARPASPPSQDPALQNTAEEAVARKATRHPCTTDEDCTGPRQAECKQLTCDEGRCVTDLSRCECTTHADCEDHDPCTRDHCFARTKKCIHIEQECP